MATLSAEMVGKSTRVRIVSAVVALLPALAAIHFGSLVFGIFILAGCLILGWEWSRMCGLPSGAVPVLSLHISSVAACVAAVFGQIGLSLALMAAGAAAGSLLASRSRVPAGYGAESAGGEALGGYWLGFGLLYYGVPAILLIWLRDSGGRELVFWLFALVWATDTGAFVFGKMIGGPKLAEAVSPNKTWAGLFGGVLCAAVVGAAFAQGAGNGQFGPLVALSAGLAVVAQGGDLFESWVKRRIGVKDAGSIMPGHGGLLDRVDGLLAVAVVIAVIAALGGEDGLVWFN
ncbi:MAG: phosphatidate cytidylyltransferase [Rhodospirillales bacterium]|nr:phosphatidate cytidylyltransferase [Rhodospirillales bacterium]